MGRSEGACQAEGRRSDWPHLCHISLAVTTPQVLPALCASLRVCEPACILISSSIRSRPDRAATALPRSQGAIRTAAALMFESDDSRWAAVLGRDTAADEQFVYGVLTTKIFCRPICKARLPRRGNVTFFSRSDDAAQAGFRACKRCKPDGSDAMPEEDAAKKIRQFLEQRPADDASAPTVSELAERLNISKWHLHRVFKKVTGLTPGEYFGRQTGNAAASPSDNSNSNSTSNSNSMKVEEIPLQQPMDEVISFPAAAVEQPGLATNSSIAAQPMQMFYSNMAEQQQMPMQVVNDQVFSMTWPMPQVRLQIQYSIRYSTGAYRLFVFRDRVVAFMHQGATDKELLYYLQSLYPIETFDRICLDDNDNIDLEFRQRLDAIHLLLDSPVGFG